MPRRRADYYRRKAEECRLQAAAAKYGEIEESWQKLAAHWERSARWLDQTIAQQAQLTQAKHRSNRDISAVECNGSLSRNDFADRIRGYT
jgi:hypothetical protein